MDIQTLLEFSGIILGTFGGGIAIVFLFSNWLGKVWANRLMEKEKANHAQELESLRNKLTHEIESYKVKLKKSEFLFEKEYEATSEFVALHSSFLPTYSRREMDDHDARDDIAQIFPMIEKELRAFLAKHGAILSEEVKKHISFSECIAAENKFELNGPEISNTANEAAGQLFESLNETEKSLIEQVKNQSNI